MKLCYISNFNQVPDQIKIKIVFHTKNYNDINIKFGKLILIFVILLIFGKSKKKTFFYLNKPSWSVKLECLSSWS